MLPILIILFVLFAIAYFLCGEPAVKHYNGGYIEPKNTDIIRNKLFFNYNDHAEQIFKIINKNNEPIDERRIQVERHQIDVYYKQSKILQALKRNETKIFKILMHIKM